jgi:acyl-CoA thioester hydrolase
VRWNDADALGHVNNAVYLSYLEAARGDLIRAALGDGVWWDCVLARIEIDFLREIPISVPEVTVRASVLRIGTSSLRTRDEVLLPDGTVAARAEAVLVVRNRDTGKARPLTADERAALERYLAVEDEPSPSV